MAGNAAGVDVGNPAEDAMGSAGLSSYVEAKRDCNV